MRANVTNLVAVALVHVQASAVVLRQIVTKRASALVTAFSVQAFVSTTVTRDQTLIHIQTSAIVRVVQLITVWTEAPVGTLGVLARVAAQIHDVIDALVDVQTRFQIFREAKATGALASVRTVELLKAKVRAIGRGTRIGHCAPIGRVQHHSCWTVATKP